MQTYLAVFCLLIAKTRVWAGLFPLTRCCNAGRACFRSETSRFVDVMIVYTLVSTLLQHVEELSLSHERGQFVAT